MTYYGIKQMLHMIDEPNRSACLKLYYDNEALFNTAEGSSFNHQAWEGGYADHVREVMNIAVMLYPVYSIRPLNFTLSDALLVLFLHDLEKPWKNDGSIGKSARAIIRALKIAEYGIKLTEQQSNALLYVEGEGNDYTNKERKMNELAAFCHVCDVSSARIFHDHGKSGEW